MTATNALTNPQLMDICTRFLKGLGATEIQLACNKLWKERGESTSITREQVNRAVKLAVERRFIRLAPPYETVAAQRFEDRFSIPPERIHVASVRDSLEHVVSAAVEVVLELIRKHSLQKTENGQDPRVHLGLGAGSTNLLFCSILAQALREKHRTDEELPPLALHALTSGFNIEAPELVPDAFFGHFDNVGHDVKMIGLFGPPLVKASGLKKARGEEITKDSFDRRDEIDIVITALASFDDEHADLKRLLGLTPQSRKEVKTRKIVGDVQYCPFDSDGPVNLSEAQRAMTLFELDELVERVAKETMDVVLVSGPCRGCGKSRHKALLPLVSSPKLKMWSHLVTDLDTADLVLAAPRP